MSVRSLMSLMSIGLLILLGVNFAMPVHAEEPAQHFVFGNRSATINGQDTVAADQLYDDARGYGLEPGTPVVAATSCVTANQPFQFSVKVPEGNYNVTITLGDPSGESNTTVKAETRRLMLEAVRTDTGQTVTRTFTLNIRQPMIRGGGQVHLRGNEKNEPDWDDKLTLEFAGPKPCVGTVDIVSAPDGVTVFLAGDSTVTDQSGEPYSSWGQSLPRFFKPGVAIANHAHSGETFPSFMGEARFTKIFSEMKPGDYLFMQFGHNDQKLKGPGVGAFTTYKANIVQIVAETRRYGGLPVLITPVSRRSFGHDGKIANNLGDFPEAVRQVAQEDHVPLIDLNEMSHRFYEAMGENESKRAFAPGDNTHHNNYGSYELAKCIVDGIRQEKLDLAKFIVDDFTEFDPSKPDPIDQFDVPKSLVKTATTKPEGN